MYNPELTTAVLNFGKLFADLPDTELDRPWQWKGHDEGIRFAFFVASREMRELTVRLEEKFPPLPPARRILSQYHSAFLDLQAVLYGIEHEDANLSPSEKDWSVRRVYAHILGADIGFSAMIRYALEGHRANTWNPASISDEDEIRLIGMSESDYQSLMKSPYENLLAYHQDLHPLIISEFSTITANELDLPATFWEPETFPIRYRLHRFEAHFRQHTIQIEKTLTAIDLAPNEAKRLIRMLYSALAETEGVLIGANSGAEESCRETVIAINKISGEIKSLLGRASPSKQ